MNHTLFKSIFLLIALLMPTPPAEAQKVKISASGGWNFTIGVSDLASGPGSDIADKDSAASATLLTVRAKNSNWVVNVSRSDTSWNGNLTLSVRRNSDGAGSGIVSGGTSFIPVGATNSLFFSGSESRSNIGIQYRQRSSVRVPPGSYSTTVIYTITQR
jgi:hypothetical protein